VGQEGYLYELHRGTIVGSDVPQQKHIAQVVALRRQWSVYDLAHPGQIYGILAGSECKILIVNLETERHPDLAIFKSPPSKRDDFWTVWLPDLVIEVISPGSETRDYTEKREEYLQAGIKEYWIVDAERQEILVLCRTRGKWKETILQAGDTYATKLFPGFELDCSKVLLAE
jgi:Uma2 family endonuclease